MLAISTIGHFIAGFLVMYLVNWLGLIAWRRAADKHWTERTRLLYPVRFTGRFSFFLIPFWVNWICWCFFPTFTSGSKSCWPLETGAAALGALLGGFPMNRETIPGLDFKIWCKQIVIIISFILQYVILIVVALTIMPDKFGWQTLLVTASCIVCVGLLNYGLIWRVFRLLGQLQPAGERLQRIVDTTAAAMGNFKVRATWEINVVMANALALPFTGEMIFLRRTLEVCTDEEIAAICAHELAHLTESKRVLAGRMFGAMALVPFIFMKPFETTFGLIGLLIPWPLVLLIARLNNRLSQRMEKRADNLATKQQPNEGIYAYALEKLYRANQSPAVNASNRQTHPHLYDRMLAAGITPDFPRPPRPKRWTAAGWALLIGWAMTLVVSIAWPWR